MDALSGIAFFVQAADTRSFSAAGRMLGVSASAVGKSICRLETRLGVRLFHRSTRSITLTAEGALFLERCRRILCEVEAAELELSETWQSPRGRLRVSLPQVDALVMPALTAFMQRYPAITLDLDFSDGFRCGLLPRRPRPAVGPGRRCGVDRADRSHAGGRQAGRCGLPCARRAAPPEGH